jgi:cyclohexadieny/prephenate dehydrogenase
VLNSFLFERITIIGLGLIGSSIARAAREYKLAETIVACDPNEVSLAFARKQGFIDTATQNAAAAVADSDLVIIATPPSTLHSVALEIAPRLKPGAIVMDTCSVKQFAIDSILPCLPKNVDFLPAHPIAGSEQSGVSAGRANLFDKKRIIVTPDDPSQKSHVLQQITTFWQAMGARLEGMPPHLHDMIYAYVSHLPQVLAFVATRPLMAQSSLFDNDQTLQKFTRLSGSDVTLWVDICLTNRAYIVTALDRYMDVIIHIIRELKGAPEGNADLANDTLIKTVLFPRVAASCLVSTVMEAEKKAGFSFARYAGNGFADFTYPATHPPEEDIENISNHYSGMMDVLARYVEELTVVREALVSEDAAQVRESLTQP